MDTRYNGDFVPLFTGEYIRRAERKGLLDTCAIAVRVGGKEMQLFMNADERTYFDVASLGKVLVTTPLILHAVGEKKLNFSDTLGKFFPYAPDDKKDITVRMLMSHMSGIPRIPMEHTFADGREAVIREMLAAPLKFKPGTSFEYSCNGLFLLGFIIETIYGITLEEAFCKFIAGPLGYTRSRFAIDYNERNAAMCLTRPTPYSPQAGRFMRFDDQNVCKMGYPGGSGGQFFALCDIMKYARAVLAKNPLICPEKVFDEAEVRQTSPDSHETRALGWRIVDEYTLEAGKLVQKGAICHSGWTGEWLFIDRKRDFYAIYLTNFTRFIRLAQDKSPTDEQKHEFFGGLSDAIWTDLVSQGIFPEN